MLIIDIYVHLCIDNYVYVRMFDTA